MTHLAAPVVHLQRLDYDDEVLAHVVTPKGRLTLTRGLGSGLARCPGDPADRLWAVGDRGPNVKAPFAIDHYGLDHLKPFRKIDGVKVMAFSEGLAIGPAISELRIEGDRVVCIRTLALTDSAGRPISGLPIHDGMGETAIDMAGRILAPDPSGADSEGIAAAADGRFWVSDEYGPSLLHVGGDGRVVKRWVAAGTASAFAGAGYPVDDVLPAIAARRQFNRGFEAVALSPDDAWLYVAFQSPLAHPDEDAHRHGRHIRIWKLSATTGEVAAQFLYPLDKPSSFRRDEALAEMRRSDLKVSEITTIAEDRLLVLERGSATAKLYVVSLEDDCAIDRRYLDVATRPTVEELSGEDLPGVAPVLTKRLMLSTDDYPQIDPDLEGVAILGPRTLLLVNDNDFGVAGVRTAFWRVELGADL